MRFAHLSDIHLGFQKKPQLQEIERRVFENALDTCIEKRVDFVLVAGDMFHVNIPEMRVQKYAFAQFRKMHEAGIPVYVIYGSHDFSPVSDSVIDLLVSTGYITKVSIPKDSENGIGLDFVTDPGTGAKICGISGLKAGKDAEYYEKLDREPLEAEPGFKIFMFHGSVTEMRDGLEPGDHMPLSLLPKDFAYYAGGHLHNAKEESFDRHPHVAYPGTPFAGHYPDLAANADGKKRGFYIAEFEDSVTDISFVETDVVQYESINVDAKGASPEMVNEDLKKQMEGIDPRDKIVIVTMRGEMTSGKTTEVDVASVSEELYEKGAVTVETNKSQMTSLEYAITGAKGKDRADIEHNVFAENIGQLRYRDENLTGERGVSLAKRLLGSIGKPKAENETGDSYNARITRDGLGVLELDTDDS